MKGPMYVLCTTCLQNSLKEYLNSALPTTSYCLSYLYFLSFKISFLLFSSFQFLSNFGITFLECSDSSSMNKSSSSRGLL